jgi:hypothetical protein
MNTRIEIYNNLYSEIKFRNNEDTRYLQNSIDSISELIRTFNRLAFQNNLNSYNKVWGIENSFHSLKNQIEENVNKYLQASKIYSLSLKIIEEDKLPFITVLQEALPDDGADQTPRWQILLLLVPSSIIFTVFAFYMYMCYGIYLRAVFS